MGSLQRFKSYEEAEFALLKEGFQRKLDVKRIRDFLKAMVGYVKNPYKPGLYRFDSFEEAARYDLQKFAEQAAKKPRSC